jgi:integrative and conjugative element protein (TIGR02256 family)
MAVSLRMSIAPPIRPMTTLEFWAENRRFGLRIGEQQTRSLLTKCESADGDETGGVLVGAYTDNFRCAVVDHVSGAPKDSSAGPNWFLRGTRGLQQMLDRFWKGGQGHYLGEWHFHPNASPQMSNVDADAITRISRSAWYNCPEPILLIIGGKPPMNWSAAATVFTRGGERIQLQPRRSGLATDYVGTP